MHNSFATILMFSAAIGTSAWAQESTNRVAAVTDWSVFVETNPSQCWSVSAPKQTVNADAQGRPKAVRRSDILMFVSFRQGTTQQQGEVSFTGGYPFAPNSKVVLDIGGTKFDLFSEGEWAWTGSAEDDAKIIAALKGGASAVIKANSARGTYTTDTFSLLGFTAAYDEAQKRCK